MVVTTGSEVLWVSAGTGKVLGEAERFEGEPGVMVPLGSDLLLITNDGFMYLLPREVS